MAIPLASPEAPSNGSHHGLVSPREHRDDRHHQHHLPADEERERDNVQERRTSHTSMVRFPRLGSGTASDWVPAPRRDP
jgi:hypothetical protein